MPIQNPADLDLARARLAAAQRLLVITHIAPDGDAIGSLLGLGLALRAAGHAPVLACADPVPEVFRFLAGADTITAAPEGDFDYAVALDVSDPARMGAVGAALGRPPDLVLDHHLTNPGFGALNFIDVAAASTAELVTELLPALGLPLPNEAAQALLTGVVSDTLGFRTSNTTPKTLGLAQTLMQAGGELSRVYDLALFKRSYSAVRLWAEGLSRMQLKHHLIWARLPLEARKAAGFQGIGDADLINLLTSVREADIALIFVERADGKVKVSWRSVAGINVAEVAAQFGGGGHAQAAGAEVAGTLDDVEAQVLAATRPLAKAARTPTPAA
ncbi:MAG: DHH family phosphoesterase [Anaerolineales bacterium]|nr:DHH family phosphoesterase [Anaerolineales bacterium]